MSVVEYYQTRLDEAHSRGEFGSAAGWARMRELADPEDLRSKVTLGLMLVKAAHQHHSIGEYGPAARAARQARQVMAAFRHPTGDQTLDAIIEDAESLFSDASRRIGAEVDDGFRSDIDPDLVGLWVNSLDGFAVRTLDFTRASQALKDDAK